MLNIFPKGSQNAWVTGIQGKVTLPNKVTVATTDDAGNPTTVTYKAGTEVPFKVRWDYDPSKGVSLRSDFWI
jgi:hypothetical protein